MGANVAAMAASWRGIGLLEGGALGFRARFATARPMRTFGFRRPRKTHTVQVRAIVLNHEGAFILIRRPHLEQWYLPGGPVEPAESLVDATRRHLIEQIGLISCGRITPLSDFDHIGGDGPETIALMLVTDVRNRAAPAPHISDVAAFPLTDLPPELGSATQRHLLAHYTRLIIAGE